MGKSVEITFVVFALFVVTICRRVARWIPACAGLTAQRLLKARLLPADGSNKRSEMGALVHQNGCGSA